MTNDELQMTKEIRSSKVERRAGVRSAVSSFGFRCSFGFSNSSFGFGDCASWRAPFRFLRMDWDHEPSGSCHRYGVPPSGGPDRLKPELQTGGSWKASGPFLPCTGTMNPPLTSPKRGTERMQRNACSPLGMCRGRERLRRFNVARHCDHGIESFAFIFRP